MSTISSKNQITLPARLLQGARPWRWGPGEYSR